MTAITNNIVKQQPDGSVILTAPVMIPGVPDCDFSRGEPPLTVEQINYFEKTYHDYRLNDDEHKFQFTGETIGNPVESFLLDEDTNFTLLNGSQKSYPSGTWMLSSRITDPEAVQTALNGGYTGYSPTVKNREVADRLISALKSETITYSEFMGACKSHSMEGLIKDVVDPVVLSVSLTKKPCQHHSKFCKHNISGDNMSEDSKIKTKVLAALGMTEEAEVSALKSQVDDLEDTMDEKFEALEGKFDSSLKSMQDSFEETLTKALKEVGSSKSKNEEEEEEEEEEGETTPSNEGGEKPPEEEEEEDEEEESKPPKKKSNGASKSRPLHNNNDPQEKEDSNTYKAMGRRPDGTAKHI